MNRQYRSLSLRLSQDNRPASLDVDSRSLEVVCATENRVRVFDWERYEPIDEILLMSGCRIPENRQVPLLDTHSRYSTSSVIGSCRDLRVSNGELLGRSYFADDPGVESTWGKVRDGHITDVSVGYSIDEAAWVPDGELAIIDGRTYEGPVRLVTRWTIKELSVCPIGADEFAKARAEAQGAGREKPGQTPMAEGNPEPQIKDNAMDKRLRAFLEGRGLPTTATEDEAWEHFRKLDIQTTPADAADVVKQAITDERERFAEISAMGARFDCTELATEMISTGVTVDQARAKVLAHVEEQRRTAPAPEPGFRIATGADERDKFRSAAEDAILIRAGVARLVEKPAAGAHDLTGYSLREMARHALMLANQPVGGNVMEMLGRAMTTGDLPNILANVANKSLFAGYETAPETWATWCDTGSAPDFKANTIAMLGEADSLDQVTEEQPYRYGVMADAKETFTLATYGKLFAITRQTLINDDLGALTSVPMAHGEAAARKVGDLPYAVLTANAAMRDGVALFASGHGNVGTSANIGEGSIAEAIKLMKLQKDLQAKRRLNIRAEYLIAPVTLEGASEIFFSSTNFSAGAANTTAVGSTRINPYAGNRFTRVYDARLDDTSTAVWYLAGPKGKTITVFFLNGQQLPYMETRQGWSVDGVEYKVRIDAAAKAVDWKALVSNAGG